MPINQCMLFIIKTNVMFEIEIGIRLVEINVYIYRTSYLDVLYAAIKNNNSDILFQITNG